MKYFVVTASPVYVSDYDSQVAVFKDEEKCKLYVDEHNVPYNKAMEQSEICRKCHTYEKDIDCFNLKDTCISSNIKEDRNGLYCENESDYYGDGTTYYTYEAVEFIE